MEIKGELDVAAAKLNETKSYADKQRRSYDS